MKTNEIKSIGKLIPLHDINGNGGRIIRIVPSNKSNHLRVNEVTNDFTMLMLSGLQGTEKEIGRLFLDPEYEPGKGGDHYVNGKPTSSRVRSLKQYVSKKLKKARSPFDIENIDGIILCTYNGNPIPKYKGSNQELLNNLDIIPFKEKGEVRNPNGGGPRKSKKIRTRGRPKGSKNKVKKIVTDGYYKAVWVNKNGVSKIHKLKLEEAIRYSNFIVNKISLRHMNVYPSFSNYTWKELLNFLDRRIKEIR